MKSEKKLERRMDRILAICSLITFAFSFTILKVIQWNDCSILAANIGIPTTFTLDRGCLVISQPGAYDPRKYVDYENYSGLISFFSIIATLSFIVSLTAVPRAIYDFIVEVKRRWENEKLSERLGDGLEISANDALETLRSDIRNGIAVAGIPQFMHTAVIREIYDRERRRRFYLLKQTLTKWPEYPDPEFKRYERPDEEFESIEDAREQMEKIAPLEKWKQIKK